VSAEIAAIRPAQAKFSQKNLPGGKLIDRLRNAFLGTAVRGIVALARGPIRFAGTIKKALRHAGFLHSRIFVCDASKNRLRGRIEVRWRACAAADKRRGRAAAYTLR
jgi:hypothetical protein